MNSIVYLNGEFLPKEKASISPDDRGFYFADGVYEVIKYYKGKPFCFADHIARLKRSIREIKINFNAFHQLEKLGNELIRQNSMENTYSGIYLQITRGPFQRMHRFPPEIVLPTLYMNAYPMPPYIDELKNGIKVILREDIRWHRCDIKSIMLLPNTLMYEEAVSAGAGDCFFVRDGCVTESTHSNIFGIKENILYTHPDSNLILPGITKIVILQICNETGIPVREIPIRADDLTCFDEFFISGTGSEVMPVVRLGDNPVNDGRPGPITRRIQQELFRKTYGELGNDWEFRKW
jgi:D-alanine transaminase